MALGTSLPYGLRDVKIAPLTSAGVVGTGIDLPNSRTFSFEEAEDFEELRGDDRVVATRGGGATISWELEAGGISLEAYAVINGGLVTTTGTTPAEVKKYSKKSTDAKPRFKTEGQSLSESGGDFHAVVHDCKATDGVSGSLEDQTFFLTAASGTAIGRASDDVLYEFIQNEAVTAILTTP